MIYYIRNDIDDLIGFKYNDEIYYYIKNGQEDIIGILDSNNNVVARYEYDSWGKVTSITGSNKEDVSTNQSHIANINPFRYRSYYYDKETNLYYLNSRYYNPVWGRFINVDSELNGNDDMLGYNMYIYVSNSPISFNDPTGKWKLPNWVKIAIGVAAVAVGVIATVATGGAALPALVAGVKAAVIAGTIAATVAVTVSVAKFISSGSDIKETVSAAAKEAVDSFSDGFMLGGIVAGRTQIISSGFKIAANLGAPTGKNAGTYITNDVKILSPNNKNFYENGGTLLKIGNNFRVDVGSNTLLHVHIFGYNHVPVGTVISGVYGGIKQCLN